MTSSRSRKLTAAVLALALIAAALVPSSAAAAKRTVRDAKFDNQAVSRNGRIDITKTTRSKEGPATKFSVSMRAKLKPSRSKERPGIFLNTRGGKRSDPEYALFGSTVFRIRASGSPVAVGEATLTNSKRTWRFSFDAAQVKALRGGYGWAAITQRGDRIADIAPDKGYVVVG